MWQNVKTFVSKTSNKGSPQNKDFQINKSSQSNKKVALGKDPKINNSRGYYYLIGKSKCIFLKLFLKDFSLGKNLHKFH